MEMITTAEYVIKELVIEIKEDLKRLMNIEETNYESGAIMAYVEVLSMIKRKMLEEDLAEVGLDMDIDKEYLGIR